MRVLVVEDEKKTASFVRKALQSEGFAVDVCLNGDDALAAAKTTPFDAVVLDIMLPGRDGLSVLRQLRERKNSVPVLLLSARGEVNERVEGLNAGADDYLPKPFELTELVAVRALTRRGGENKSTLLRTADLTLDTLTHQAGRSGKAIELTAREYRLLEFDALAGRPCGRMMILEKVWDYDFDPGTNLVDVYIRRLREKIDAGFEPKLLHTVRGAGYVLKGNAMTIRTRLALWYAVIFSVSLLVIGASMYSELVVDQRAKLAGHQGVPVDSDAGTDITQIILLYGGSAVAIGLLGGWWLTRRALAPISALTEAVEKIHARNLDRIPRSGNHDELDRLTEVFNAMTARLSESFTRIREFTLNASHELKTPLTVMCGEAETTLRDESVSAPERERAASQLDELRRLTRIVDGLTLLAKADAGQVSLALEPVRLDELVRDNFADLQILAEPQGIKVKLETCEDISVRGDRHRLRQLLLNLADNAVKYNLPQGSVTMNLRRLTGHAELTIANTGAGISAEHLPRVFDRFFRGDAAHGCDVDGCGLGLSIAQWIVAAHHGTIKIESVPAQLTTITVHLPLEKS